MKRHSFHLYHSPKSVMLLSNMNLILTRVRLIGWVLF